MKYKKIMSIMNNLYSYDLQNKLEKLEMKRKEEKQKQD